MIDFLLGAALVVVLYTFWPSLAVVPSGWVRKGWAWLNSKQAP